MLHCGTCGGVIGDRSKIAYRLPNQTVVVATEHEGRCGCPTPVIYGAPPGFASIPSMPKAPMPPPGAKVSRGPRRWS